ncbi:hypothetical protein SNEBB_007008 [Seison nebaliae]|nr:hypothetical protein SNEBB_007008 [Seison nebaliae]
MSNENITRINNNIKSIKSIKNIDENVTTLNLHSNFIERIEGLENCDDLERLNLSSNCIRKMENVDQLRNLIELNLSGNFLKNVNGIKSLKRLKMVNLSHNMIDNLTGFSDYDGRQLETILLHNNRIRQMIDLIKNLKEIKSLRHLSVSENPLCLNDLSYRSTLFRVMSFLLTIDEYDKYNKNVSINFNNDVNELDIDLISNDFDCADYPIVSSSTVKKPSPTEINNENWKSENKKNNDKPKNMEEYYMNLLNIDTGNKMEDNCQFGQAVIKDLLRIINEQQVRQNETKIIMNELNELSDKKLSKNCENNLNKHVNESTTNSIVIEEPLSMTIKSKIANDENYKNLLNDYENERREKKHLQTTIDELKRKIDKVINENVSNQQMEMMTMNSLNRLKVALEREQNRTTFLDKCLNELKYEMSRLKENEIFSKNEIDKRKNKEKELLKDLNKLKDYTESLELDRERKRECLREATVKIDKQLRKKDDDIDRWKDRLNSYKLEQQQLESDYKFKIEELERRLKKNEELSKLGPTSITSIFEEEKKILQDSFLRQTDELQRRLDGKDYEYQSLENEFRLALQIEEDRYQMKEKEVEELKSLNEANRIELRRLKEDNEKCERIIHDLNDVIKDMKIKLKETSNCRQETRSITSQLTTKYEEAMLKQSELKTKLSLLEEKNIKLSSDLIASQSAHQALVKEKEIWSGELARQGASLAHDRGAMKAEIEGLKRDLSRETESHHLTRKQLGEQIKSINKLKESLMERDDMVKRIQMESLDKERRLMKKCDDFTFELNQNKDVIEHLKERKDLLKNEIVQLNEQLDEWKEKEEKMNEEWKTKSEMISGLHSRISLLKDKWTSKEKMLLEEKENLKSQLNSIDNECRDQLMECERKHSNDMGNLVRMQKEEKEKLEDEMKEILCEKEKDKKEFEEKIRNLIKNLKELT